MSALITDRPIVLTTIAQRLLAALLCLITVRWEFTNPEMQGVPAADRKTISRRACRRGIGTFGLLNSMVCTQEITGRGTSGCKS